MIKTVVFDFDGTLVDSNNIKRNSFYDVVVDIPNGISILNKIFASSEVGDRYKIFLKFAMASMGEASDNSELVEMYAAQLASHYTRRCERLLTVCPEIAGATNALKNLRLRGYSLYINSATPQPDLLRVIAQRGFNTLVDGVFGGPTSKLDNLQTIIARENSLPDCVVVVGDGETDRLASVLAGCPFIAVDNGTAQFVERPGYRIPDLHELDSLITVLEQRGVSDVRESN